MTISNQRILIIGGGFSGMAAAIELRKAGHAVDLVEIDADWRSYGAGISLGGATMRAFRQLGVLDTFLQQGAASESANAHVECEVHQRVKLVLRQGHVNTIVHAVHGVCDIAQQVVVDVGRWL